MFKKVHYICYQDECKLKWGREKCMRFCAWNNETILKLKLKKLWCHVMIIFQFQKKGKLVFVTVHSRFEIRLSGINFSVFRLKAPLRVSIETLAHENLITANSRKSWKISQSFLRNWSSALQKNNGYKITFRDKNLITKRPNKSISTWSNTLSA